MTVTIHSATESPADATKVTMEWQKYTNETGVLFYPGTIREYTRKQGDEWYDTLLAGGSPDPTLQAVLRKKSSSRSPVSRGGFQNAGWWPNEGKEPGDTWPVSLATLAESGVVDVPPDERRGAVTGRLLKYRVEGDRHIADVEFTIDVSSSRTTDRTKSQSHSIGKVTCTVDLSRNFISESSSAMETTTVTTIPMPDGAHTSTSNIVSQMTTSIRPF
jgi:hypothetical protein